LSVLAELKSVLFCLIAGPPVRCEGLLAQGVAFQAESALGKIQIARYPTAQRMLDSVEG
jgi:hypothetical protein